MGLPRGSLFDFLLTGENWKKYEDILTDSLWIINERDKSGKHSNFYHGNFIPQIPNQLIKRYTKKGDFVLDLFLGSGTTAIECENLERNIIGVDIKEELVQRAQELIYKNYSLSGTKGTEFERQYFSPENALKCDAIRYKIEKWKKEEKINENEYYFLLTSLLEATDKIANTASVYGAFLKQLKKSALKPLVLKPAEYFHNDQEHFVFNEDINTLIEKTSHDVVYLDPPYNERQYSANYHILETIAKYDNPKIKGKTGLRDYSKQKSKYCQKGEVLKSFDNLVQNIDAKYIFLSYNDEGLMSLNEIKEIMSKRGEYGVVTQKYKRFKADKSENRNHKKDFVIEYLHYVKIN